MTTPVPGPDLEAAVARTSGPQPWRRLFHALTGLVVAFALTFGPWSDATARAVLTVFAVVLFTLDLIRLRHTGTNLLFFRLFSALASPREAAGIASSTWYMVGIALALWVAPVPAVVSGIAVLALADPAASYYGRRWGTRPFLGGSLEGSTVFVLVAFAALAPRHAWSVALVAAVLGALIERRSWPLDDNLALPVGTALIVHLMQA